MECLEIIALHIGLYHFAVLLWYASSWVKSSKCKFSSGTQIMQLPIALLERYLLSAGVTKLQLVARIGIFGAYTSYMLRCNNCISDPFAIRNRVWWTLHQVAICMVLLKTGSTNQIVWKLIWWCSLLFDLNGYIKIYGLRERYLTCWRNKSLHGKVFWIFIFENMCTCVYSSSVLGHDVFPEVFPYFLLGMKQCYNILIYCNIYYCNTIQYGLKEISIYCNVCCHNVINTQSLHHKNDWTSKNLDYSLQFLMVLYSYTGCSYILYFTAKTHIPIWNVFLTKSNRILQYGNIL